MASVHRTVLAVCCALVLSGCKPSIVGKWNVETDFQGMSAKGTMEYRKDNTLVAELVGSAGGQQITSSLKGTWRMEQKDGKSLLIIKYSEITIAGHALPAGDMPEVTAEVEFGKGSFTVTPVGGPGAVVKHTRAD